MNHLLELAVRPYLPDTMTQKEIDEEEERICCGFDPTVPVQYEVIIPKEPGDGTGAAGAAGLEWFSSDEIWPPEGGGGGGGGGERSAVGRVIVRAVAERIDDNVEQFHTLIKIDGTGVEGRFEDVMSQLESTDRPIALSLARTSAASVLRWAPLSSTIARRAVNHLEHHATIRFDSALSRDNK